MKLPCAIKFDCSILVFLLVSVSLYLFSILSYSSNAPIQDDFDAILNFLNQYSNADLTQKFQLIFSQHNEHRIALIRLFALLDVALFDQINFYHLILIGNLGWVSCIYVLWIFAKNSNITFIEYSPAIILLLSFSQFDLMTWSMGSIQQYYQLLFALLAIYSSTNFKLLLSVIFTFLASFTGGGGLLAGLFVILIFALSKKYRQAFIVFLIYIAIVFIYFVLLKYSSPAPHGSLQTISIFNIPAFSAAFLGGLGKSKTLSFLFGMVSFFLLFKLFSNSQNIAPNFKNTVFFILATAILAAITRGSGGLDTATNSKYSEYSLLYFSAIYMIFLSQENTTAGRKIIKNIFSIFSIIIFLYWLPTGIRELNSRFEQAQNNQIQYPSAQRGVEILNQSRSSGIFRSDLAPP